MKIHVSIGEVFDKLTILRIKKNKIIDIIKLHYIEEEIKLLEKSLMKENIIVNDNLANELFIINSKLWDTEELIRNKEKLKNFDEEFIDLARKDALLNDERFLVKNKINNFYHSTVKEQKSYEGLYTAN